METSPPTPPHLHDGVISCHACRLMQHLPPPLAHRRCRCFRCHEVLRPMVALRREQTLALTLGALILYIPANVLPFMTMTQGPNRDSYTIFQGIEELYSGGMFLVAGLVLTASIIIPGFKIAGLLFLVARGNAPRGRLARTRIFMFIEFIGRWSMLDVFLLSILITLAQLGALVSVTPEPGIIFFAAVVLTTIFAAMRFDARLIWQDAAGGPDA